MPNVSVQCMITNLCSDKVCMQAVIDSKNMHEILRFVVIIS